MDVQDHKKTTYSEHEIHGVHLCHKCGWPFPNPHPSAKHRRAHKRVCGTVEGYKLIDSASDHANLAGSDSEHLSDDEQRTPSPKVDKGRIKELGSSGGMGLNSSRSEDELFSDAVTDFSDNGVSPSLEERLESVKQLDKKNVGGELLHDLEDSHVSKDKKTADTSQPHCLTQLQQGPKKASEMSDSDVAGCERNQSEITKSISDIGTENVSVGVSSTNGLEFDSSQVVTEPIAVSDNSNSENGKQKELIPSGPGTDVKEKEKGDEALDGSTAASEVLQSEHKFEIEPKLEEIEGKTSGPVALEAMALETDKDTSDPHIDYQSKLNNVNGETSHAGIVDEKVDQEKELTNDLQSKHDVSSQIEPPKFEDASVVSEVEADSAKNLIRSSNGQSDEVCDLKDAGNEDTHSLSAAKTLPAVENLEVMIGDFKDYKVLKSSFPLDLGGAEEIRSVEDDKKVPVPENLPSAFSNVPAGSLDKSSSDALEGDLEKEGVSRPIDGEVGISDPENLPSALSSVHAGTVYNSSSDALEDNLKKEGVSTTIGGEFDTSVTENLPIAHSSVPAGNVDISSSEALEDDLKKEGVLTHIDVDAGTSVPENLPSALSSVPAGTVDNSSSEALKDDPEKEGVSTHIGGKVGTSVPEILPCALSSVPAGTAHNSSSEALEDDLKKVGVSTPIDGEVGTSVPEILPSAFSSVPAGTVDNSEALGGDLKEGVSTPIDGEVGTSVPVNLPSALSSVPAGTVGNSSSEALEGDLEKEVVSTPIDGEVGTSVPEILPCALSSVPAGTAHNSSSESLEDDLKKEGVSTPIDGEVGTSVPEILPSALSSVPAGTVDNSSSAALEGNLKEGFSTPIDGEVGISVLENFPRALSSVPAETVGNSPSEALEGDLEKEVVSTSIDGEVDSSGFRVTSDEDTRLLSVAKTLPAVENPKAMVGDFKDYKVLESSFSLDVGAAEEIGSVEDDKKFIVPKNLPSALSNIPAGSVDNYSSDTLEDDLKKEGFSIPIDGEVDASGFGGTSDEDTHLLLVAETSPALENPEVMTGDFKDYKVLKSSFPLDLGAVEEIRSVENDKKVTIPENLPSAVSNIPAGSIDNSSSDALKDDLKKEGVSIPIDGEIGASGFRVTGDADFGSSGLGDHPKTSGPETNNIQTNSNLEGSLSQSVNGKSLQNEDSEPTTRNHSDVIPLESSTGEQTWQTTNLYGAENADNHGIDKPVCVTTENGNVQAGDERAANITSTLTHVEAIPETIEKSISLTGDDGLGHETSRMGFSSIAGNEAVEVAAEEKLGKQADATHKSTQQLTNSANLDGASGSNKADIDIKDSGKLYDSSESPKCSDEIPNAFEGLKMGDETEVPRSAGTPGMVSEPKYEDPTVTSEKTSENSSFKEIAAFPVESEFLNKSSASIEDMNIREAIVSGPLLDDGEDKVIKQHFSVPTVDNSFVSSSGTDSLEGNWGSVSVLSTQSDVTAVADAEVLSSTDTQAAEKLDSDFEKPQAAATECHPDKSDVFEPPSFMTLVESGVGVDKNAAASEIQTAQRDEWTKSESLKAGWFPSLTNVVNESEGRKKNEEIIAKVTNWSTGKQHSPLKNLLSEAHAETKVKSPNTKQVPAVNQADETASRNNGTAVTTVGSILGSEMPSADTVKKDIEKEWNSPARYPIQIKKEKRKGKPYWVPFVCCTSVHQDV